mmetsp:Transcript_14098/g.19103  ORF Transcript_14098/g.19103 Transcript_14098/m.19103 type:complete len:83 (+) Transcript_14098:795-1043(+)
MEHSNSSKYIILDDFEPNSSDLLVQMDIMYPFTMAFGFLCAGSFINFEEAMYRTVLQGGNTNVNCCIVGGLIGAAVGEANIP